MTRIGCAVLRTGQDDGGGRNGSMARFTAHNSDYPASLPLVASPKLPFGQLRVVADDERYRVQKSYRRTFRVTKEKPLNMTPDSRAYMQDIELLYSTLSEKHPDLYWQGKKAEIDQQFEELESKSQHSKLEEVILGLMELFALIGDAHTQLYDYVPRKVVPLRFSVFPDGACVTTAGSEHKHLLRKRITRVAGIEFGQILQKLKPYVTYENKWGFLAAASDKFRDALVLRNLGLLNGRDTLQIELEFNGETNNYIVPVCCSSEIEWTGVYEGTENDPLFVRRDQSFWTTHLAPRVLYFQFNEFVPIGSDGTSLEALSHDLVGRYQANAPGTLVIDLRHNSGGNYSVADPLVTSLRKAHTDYSSSRIVVLIGRETFSAAMLLAYELRHQVGAILLGEPTRARLNCYGNTHRLELESLGLTVLYSTNYFQLSKTNQDAIYPDEHLPMTSEGFLAGRDPAMQCALEMPNSGTTL